MNKKYRYRYYIVIKNRPNRARNRIVIQQSEMLAPDVVQPEKVVEQQPLYRPVSLFEQPRIERIDKACIYSSELDFIGKCILERPDIETGGQLFGYWTASGKPVVVYAIGPGPKANHQIAFFNQDVSYLESVGSILVSQFGLMHIGEWHSHHQLGLASPSGHDANTMQSSINSLHLRRFLLCIGNCDGVRFSINPFVFTEGESDYSKADWEIKGAVSPLRGLIDEELKKLGYDSPSVSRSIPKPQFDINDSWFGDKGNRVQFKQMIDYLSSLPQTVSVQSQINGATVELFVNGIDKKETIRFPIDYPNSPLEVQRQFMDGSRQNYSIPPIGGPETDKNVFDTFINQYNSIAL